MERFLEPPPNYESMDANMLGVRLLSLMPRSIQDAQYFPSDGADGSVDISVQGSEVFGLVFPIFYRTTLILPPAGLPPSAKGAADCLKYVKADTLCMILPYIKSLSPDQEFPHFISTRIESIM